MKKPAYQKEIVPTAYNKMGWYISADPSDILDFWSCLMSQHLSCSHQDFAPVTPNFISRLCSST